MSILPTSNIQAVGIAYDLLNQEIDDSIKALRTKASQEAGSGSYLSAETAITEAKQLEIRLLEISIQQKSWTERYAEINDTPTNPVETKPMIITYTSGEIHASALYGSNGKTTLFSGATIKAETYNSLSETVRKQRLDMLQRGELREKSNQVLELCVDCEFGSPSGAAVFVVGSSTNGHTFWKVRDTGETLKAWERRTTKPLDLSTI